MTNHSGPVRSRSDFLGIRTESLLNGKSFGPESRINCDDFKLTCHTFNPLLSPVSYGWPRINRVKPWYNRHMISQCFECTMHCFGWRGDFVCNSPRKVSIIFIKDSSRKKKKVKVIYVCPNFFRVCDKETSQIYLQIQFRFWFQQQCGTSLNQVALFTFNVVFSLKHFLESILLSTGLLLYVWNETKPFFLLRLLAFFNIYPAWIRSTRRRQRYMNSLKLSFLLIIYILAYVHFFAELFGP